MNEDTTISYERKRNLYLLIIISILFHSFFLYIFFKEMDQVRQVRQEFDRGILPILNYIQEPEEEIKQKVEQEPQKLKTLDDQDQDLLKQKIAQIANQQIPQQKEIATMRQRGGIPVPMEEEPILQQPLMMDPAQAGNPIEDKSKFFEDGVGVEEPQSLAQDKIDSDIKPKIEPIEKVTEIEKKSELGIITQTDELDGDKHFMQLEEFKVSENQKLKEEKNIANNSAKDVEIDKKTKNKVRPKRPTRKWILAKEHKTILPTITSGLLGGSLGNDPINWKGNDNLVPDLEQMRQASYIQKIHQFMQTAYLVKYPAIGFKILNSPLTMQIGIKIDKNGKIISTKKLLSSGSEEVDSFILSEVIPYSGPFPPIPKHLNLEVFEYNPIIYIYN